jgi:hypothetical protein
MRYISRLYYTLIEISAQSRVVLVHEIVSLAATRTSDQQQAVKAARPGDRTPGVHEPGDFCMWQ